MRKRTHATPFSHGIALPFLLLVGAAYGAEFSGSWSHAPDRVWPGPEYWANRLQDWQVVGGRLECIEARPVKPMRTVHLLTHSLREKPGDFTVSVRTGLIKDGKADSPDAATGFLVGAGRGLDYRAAALIHHSLGPNGGMFAGIDATGALFIRDFGVAESGKGKKVGPKLLVRQEGATSRPIDIELRLRAVPILDGRYSLLLSTHDPKTGEERSRITTFELFPGRFAGQVALVSHPGSGDGATSFWFNDFHLSGRRVVAHKGRECGPVLSAQYTVHRGVLKLTAQMMPLGRTKNRTVVLEVEQGGLFSKTVSRAKATVIVPGWVAVFRINDWDAGRDASYRVLYDMEAPDGNTKQFAHSGKIRRDPGKKNPIVVAAFTGNHNTRRGIDSGRYSWTEDHLWFPHNEIVEHVAQQHPDLLFFSGDNVYEGASPTAADRSGERSSYYDYLYKWYLWCWAFRDLTREIPCVAIPDDHDVYQGNVWGAGGRKTDKDDKGGYVMPAQWVNMVHDTQVRNLPDPYDPSPIEQDIKVYYTALNWGRIGFAILEDRKFKSGPNGLCPPTTSGRADHVIDPNFDPKTADVPGAKLLGDRQLKFLHDWATDWKGVDMKAALSQTVFAGMATHHGGNLMYLVADYDSNGWPQTGRNKALDAFRRCFAFMIGGDQHLATIVHHGIDDWNDAGWSFTVPSIANFYPRAWRPKVPGRNRQPDLPEYTGEYLDGLGNHVTVWAATNPGESMGREPAALYDKMPGYGIVRFDKENRTITMECWPRFADPMKDKQYSGWPKTIGQFDNYGRKAAAYLPTLNVKGVKDPVVQVVDEANGERVYTVRIKGTAFRPKVFREGSYTIKVSEPDREKSVTLENVRSLPEHEEGALEVRL